MNNIIQWNFLWYIINQNKYYGHSHVSSFPFNQIGQIFSPFKPMGAIIFPFKPMDKYFPHSTKWGKYFPHSSKWSECFAWIKSLKKQTREYLHANIYRPNQENVQTPQENILKLANKQKKMHKKFKWIIEQRINNTIKINSER